MRKINKMTRKEAHDIVYKMDAMSIGWNGYSAEPPAIKARLMALDFLDKVFDKHLEPRRIAASAMGGVGVHINGWYVEFLNNGHCAGIRMDDDDDAGEIKTPAE